MTKKRDVGGGKEKSKHDTGTFLDDCAVASRNFSSLSSLVFFSFSFF